MPKTVVDIHIHVAAREEPGCRTSGEMIRSLGFAYMLMRNPVHAPALAVDFDGAIRNLVVGALDGAESVDKGVVVALDGVCRDGALDEGRSHYVVSNEYVRRLAEEHPKVLWGASINPMRCDAVALLNDCLAWDPPPALLKWIPNTQQFDPMDVPDEFYDLAKTQAALIVALANPRTMGGWFRRAYPLDSPNKTQTIETPFGKRRCITISGRDCRNVREGKEVIPNQITRKRFSPKLSPRYFSRSLRTISFLRL